MAEDTVRLRVVFDDRRMLSESQKSEGLKRSWLLFPPQEHTTISDLASHLLDIFDLQDSCPNGLTLSMDGFVFPPFESTCILKDKDIICVRRKRGTLSDVIKILDGSDFIEEDEIMAKQTVHTDIKLLANKKFEKERCYQSESEKDECDEPVDTSPEKNGLGITGNSKNRLAPKQRAHTRVESENNLFTQHLANEESEKESGGYQSVPEEGECDELVDSLQEENLFSRNGNLKKRKAPKKIESSKRKKRCSALPKDVENDGLTEKLESSYHKKSHPRKSPPKIQKSFAIKGNLDTANTLEIAERSIASKPNSNMCAQLHENATSSVDLPDVTNGIIKLISRSARRKKAKRKWLRELAKVEKEDVNWRQTFDIEVHRITTECQQQDERCESGDDVVPVVIRPGHIRFESIDKEQVVQPNQVPVETFHWNGITSKKKGQKWGTEKFSSPGSNGYKDFNNHDCSDMPPFEEVTIIMGPSSVDFDKLSLLVSSPKEGDVLAYRLLELSSSWTPELSSFRVGKTSSYDRETNMIVLVPVPEYPIVPEKNLGDNESMLPPDTSFYKEDGSLEIDFASLVDVRIVKLGNSLPVKELANGPPVGNQDVSDGVVNKKGTTAPIAENGEVNAWDEISQVLSAKKAQLSQEDGWSKKGSSERSPWSSRAVRGSALGPTMALLRSKNDL